ncbi:hypothetical protein GX408_09875 [bacterium]|nr:hypothetical protein [bacterium]
MRFNSARQEAFQYFVHQSGIQLRAKKTCLRSRLHNDVIVSVFGFPVMADSERAFENMFHFIEDDGYYIPFDPCIRGCILPDFAADQSRRSRELVEGCFDDTEINWFGTIFIAIDHGKTKLLDHIQIVRRMLPWTIANEGKVVRDGVAVYQLLSLHPQLRSH